MEKLSTKIFDIPNLEEREVFYREGTTDFNCLKEVLIQKHYMHKRLGINVEEGELWLDLGANIGAFALYCLSRGTSGYLGYEPDKENFSVLKRNTDGLENYKIVNSAVSNRKEKKIEFFTGKKLTDRYRYSLKPNKTGRSLGKLSNKYGAFLRDQSYDGVKMDIEGAEFGLIDDYMLPSCSKLVLEYHFTKDKDISNFQRRMSILREQFSLVHYAPCLDKFNPSKPYPGFFDQIIYCKK